MQDADYRLYHWRCADQRVIDILIDCFCYLVCVEFKASASVNGDDFKHLKWFSKDGPGRCRACTGIVLYLGQEEITFGDRNFTLLVSALWSNIIAWVAISSLARPALACAYRVAGRERSH